MRAATTADWQLAAERAANLPICAAAAQENLVSPLMLVHYDPKLPIILSADASPVGVGAVISHRLPDGRELPIAHASKTLTPTEGRYP